MPTTQLSCKQIPGAYACSVGIASSIELIIWMTVVFSLLYLHAVLRSILADNRSSQHICINPEAGSRLAWKAQLAQPI